MNDKSGERLAAEPKKKGVMGIVLIILGTLVLGGGGAFGLMYSGLIGGGISAEVAKVERGPQLVKKGETDTYAPPPKEGSGKAETAEVAGEGGDAYRTAYFTFSEDFTSNLKGSDAMIQASLACSTRRDGRVLQWLAKHELAIRSRLLEILADTPEDDVTSIAGKERLNKRLTTAINQVLVKKEGFGGVDAVYFRNFIVQ